MRGQNSWSSTGGLIVEQAREPEPAELKTREHLSGLLLASFSAGEETLMKKHERPLAIGEVGRRGESKEDDSEQCDGNVQLLHRSRA